MWYQTLTSDSSLLHQPPPFFILMLPIYTYFPMLLTLLFSDVHHISVSYFTLLLRAISPHLPYFPLFFYSFPSPVLSTVSRQIGKSDSSLCSDSAASHRKHKNRGSDHISGWYDRHAYWTGERLIAQIITISSSLFISFYVIIIHLGSNLPNLLILH